MSADLDKSLDNNDDNEEAQIKSEEDDGAGSKTEHVADSDNPVEKTEQYNKPLSSDSSEKSKPINSKASSNKTIQIRSVSRSRSRSRSASRSQIRSARKQTPFTGRASSNPFLIFLQQFRQNYAGMRSKEIAKLAGERWRQMSIEEKQPYKEAAKRAKERENNRKRKDSSQTSNARTTSKNSYSKAKKKKRDRQESNSDSASVSSGTADTAGTSEAGTE